MSTANDIITNALYEMGAYSFGETPSAQDMAFALSNLNRMVDAWNSSKIYLVAYGFASFNMIASHNPLTIGQGVNITSVSATGSVATYVGQNQYTVGQLVSTNNIGTIGGVQFNQTKQAVQSVAANGSSFTLTCGAGTVGSTNVTGMAIIAATPPNAFPDIAIPSTRPVKIVNANIILNPTSGPESYTRVPMRIVDHDWWANQRVPKIQTDLPTHLYYQPDWPNGSMFLWPVPDVGYPVEIETWTNLTNFPNLTQTFTMPPGYEDAITYSLAERLCPSFGRPIDQTLVALGRNARGLIQGNNVKAPTITTQDYGLPKGEPTRPYWNWLAPQDLTGGR